MNDVSRMLQADCRLGIKQLPFEQQQQQQECIDMESQQGSTGGPLWLKYCPAEVLQQHKQWAAQEQQHGAAAAREAAVEHWQIRE